MKELPNEQIKITPEEYRNEIAELATKLNNIVADLIDSDFNQTEEIMEKVANFSEKIKKEFPDYSEYSAWHGLAVSTISEYEAPITKLDFPDEYNVKHFLSRLLKEVEKKKV